MGEREREPARLRHHEQDPVAGPEAAALPRLGQHHEDARRTGVAPAVQVGEPAVLVDHQVGGAQQPDHVAAELLGAVVAEHVVDLPGIDPPDGGQARELPYPRPEEVRSIETSCVSRTNAGSTARDRRARRGRRPCTPAARARTTRGASSPPAGREGAGAARARRRPRRRRRTASSAGTRRRPPATDDARSARETSSEPTTTAAAWSPAATARDRTGQRRHARRAHAAGRQQLHRAAAEPAVHHRREPGHEHVALRRTGGQHAHLVGRDAAVLERGLDRGGGQLLVEHRDLATGVERVVAGADAVGRHHPLAQARPRVTEAPGRLVVVDRVAGKVGAHAGEVDRHGISEPRDRGRPDERGYSEPPEHHEM